MPHGHSSVPLEFIDLFEETDIGRRSLFESVIPGGFRGPKRQAVSQLFQPTFNEYLGQLGQQMGTQNRQGPLTTFRQYLTEKFDPGRELLRFPGGALQRGALTTPAMFSFQR
ncbi:MAG: hypothetical protein V3R87_10155 [Dehalococcoidia bacterium]